MKNLKKVTALVLVICFAFFSAPSTVSAAWPTSITLSESNMTMKVEDITTLSATVLPADASQYVEFTAFPSGIVEIWGQGSTCSIEAIETGFVTITARAADYGTVAYCTINVQPKATTTTPTPTPTPTVKPKTPSPWLFDGGQYTDNQMKTTNAGSTIANIDKGMLKHYGLHDNISSIKVPIGWSVTLYEDDGFKGRTTTYSAYADDIMIPALPKGVNDETSSVVAKQLVLANPAVTVFGNSNVDGPNFQSFLAGRYNITQLTAGVGNDAISSIYIPAGYRATLYEHQNFSGTSVSYTATTLSLGAMDNKASSIVVEKIK